jgi:hypothetical protein
MKRAKKIDIELVKLTNGVRLMRLTSQSSTLALEQQLDQEQAVSTQKKLLLSLFKAVLKQSE